ncbi:MAG: DUF6788 family protein [Planctomycetota bacterium]
MEAILRGSLIERYKPCGRPGCKCAKGPGHGPKYYLSVSQAIPGQQPGDPADPRRDLRDQPRVTTAPRAVVEQRYGSCSDRPFHGMGRGRSGRGAGRQHARVVAADRVFLAARAGVQP